MGLHGVAFAAGLLPIRLAKDSVLREFGAGLFRSKGLAELPIFVPRTLPAEGGSGAKSTTPVSTDQPRRELEAINKI